MENSEYVKVELERYEDLIIAEEQLRTLTSIIFNNLRYSQVANRLTIDEDKAIMAYIESTWSSALRVLTKQEKAKYVDEDKE